MHKPVSKLAPFIFFPLKRYTIQVRQCHIRFPNTSNDMLSLVYLPKY